MGNYYEIYDFLGINNLNDINYNEYNDFDARYSYTLRIGETKQFVTTPNSSINLLNYDSILVKMFSNNSEVITYSGATADLTGSTGEIYLNGSTLTINLTESKSELLAAGVLYTAVRVIGSSVSEYQMYLGSVYKGFTN